MALKETLMGNSHVRHNVSTGKHVTQWGNTPGRKVGGHVSCSWPQINRRPLSLWWIHATVWFWVQGFCSSWDRSLCVLLRRGEDGRQSSPGI